MDKPPNPGGPDFGTHLTLDSWLTWDRGFLELPSVGVTVTITRAVMTNTRESGMQARSLKLKGPIDQGVGRAPDRHLDLPP